MIVPGLEANRILQSIFLHVSYSSIHIFLLCVCLLCGFINRFIDKMFKLKNKKIEILSCIKTIPQKPRIVLFFVLFFLSEV